MEKNNYYLSILLTSSKSSWQNNQKKYTQHKHKHKGGANLSRLKSRENFAPLNKYFQASIGNHLKTNKQKQLPARHAKLSPAEWPPPASGFGTT